MHLEHQLIALFPGQNSVKNLMKSEGEIVFGEMGQVGTLIQSQGEIFMMLLKQTQELEDINHGNNVGAGLTQGWVGGLW